MKRRKDFNSYYEYEKYCEKQKQNKEFLKEYFKYILFVLFFMLMLFSPLIILVLKK